MKVFASTLFLFLFCGFAFAQNCGTTQCAYFGRLSDKEYATELNKYDAIFYGEIVSQDEPVHPQSGQGFPYRVLKIRISRVWKGALKDEAEIQFNFYDEDCLLLGQNGSHIFYVVNGKDAALPYTGFCTQKSFVDDRTRRLLGEGTAVQELIPLQKYPEPKETFVSRIFKWIISFFG